VKKRHHSAKINSTENEIKPSTDTKWQIEGNYLIRQYEFSGLPSPQPTALLQIVCRLIRNPASGRIATEIKVVLQPYLYLLDDQQPFPDYFVDAPFLVGLRAASYGQGTDDDPIYRGGLFEVSAYSYEAPDTAALVLNPRDWTKVLNAVSTGKKLTFGIYTHDLKPRLCLKLPNEKDFVRLHDQLRAVVASRTYDE
jgi:hypothetical protein